MILAVDAGNTRVKAAVFENNRQVFSAAFQIVDLRKNIENILQDFPKIDVLVGSSVINLEQSVFDFIKNRVKIEWISASYSFPFENFYQTPHTLGIDRQILASGAVLRFPAQNRLVIDAGSCITYDFITENNEYLGGAISLGLQMRYRALSEFTDKLPLLTVQNPNHFIGNTTQESIHSGVVNGLVHEIEGFLKEYESLYSNFTIILTGGDAVFLAKRLKNTIFANSNFLLESLHDTYQYKIKND